jgi:purine-nucleoside/S-methyl-5'-thioadenosine phosphorylase / adenosine deaminase
LLMVDPTTKAVGAAHAGWRGLAAGVPAAVVQAMRKNFGSRSSDLVVAIGPSIGACCYEVGSDVREAFSAKFPESDVERWFSDEPKQLTNNPPMPNLKPNGRADHWFFDSWRSVRDQLEAAGVPPERMFPAELCTASHPHVLCSYRRDGTPTGRMAAAVRCLPLRP